MNVRFLSAPGDVPELAAIHEVCFGAEKWKAAQIENSLALPTTTGFVVEDEGRMQGFLLAQSVMEEAEILTLAVDPAFRRKGAGAALVRAAMDLPGISCVFLEVAADNVAARGLYEALGFEEFGVRPAYYKRATDFVDAVTYRLMVKR